MKSKIFLGASTLLLSIVLVSCGPDDTKIQKEVSQKLSDTSLPVTGVVDKGAVTLIGEVETDGQKTQAESAVQPIKGVKSITNNITVTPPPPPPVVITPDEALTTLAKEGLAAAGFSTVNVSVADSVITLSGSAKKSDLKNVMKVVNDLKPRKVINEIK